MEQNELLLKHDERLSTLEENDREQDRQIRELQQNYQKLESTIVQENRETRMIFQSTMDKQWDLIKTRDIAKESASQREHELEKSKLERRTELLLKLLGAGGLIYLCAQSFLDILTK